MYLIISLLAKHLTLIEIKSFKCSSFDNMNRITYLWLPVHHPFRHGHSVLDFLHCHLFLLFLDFLDCHPFLVFLDCHPFLPSLDFLSNSFNVKQTRCTCRFQKGLNVLLNFENFFKVFHVTNLDISFLLMLLIIVSTLFIL